MVIREYSKVELVFSSSESEAVKIALVNLRRDLIRTLDCSVRAGGIIRILVGTVGNLPELDEKADISKLRAEDGTYRKEAFLIQEKDGELFRVSITDLYPCNSSHKKASCIARFPMDTPAAFA